MSKTPRAYFDVDPEFLADLFTEGAQPPVRVCDGLPLGARFILAETRMSPDGRLMLRLWWEHESFAVPEGYKYKHLFPYCVREPGTQEKISDVPGHFAGPQTTTQEQRRIMRKAENSQKQQIWNVKP